MQNFNFSLTRDPVYDFFVKYRKKTFKLAVAAAVCIFVIAALLIVGQIFVENANYLLTSVVFLGLGIFMIMLAVGVKRGNKTLADVYFKQCQVNGIINYVYQTDVDEFVVLQPDRGNVTHYYYNSISQVIQLDGYVAVILDGNLCLPIPDNADTRPLIDLLKSHAKIKRK